SRGADGDRRAGGVGCRGGCKPVDEQILSFTRVRSAVGHRRRGWHFGGRRNSLRPLARVESGASESHRRAPLGIGPQKAHNGAKVKCIETLKLAVAAIWAHKLRSALTLLGMIVGVTAFVVVVSLIEGFNRYVDEKIAGIGAKSFTVQRFNPLEDFKDTDTIAAAQRRNKELTLDDYEYLKERAQLIGKIGARARGTPSEVKRGDELIEDVFVS